MNQLVDVLRGLLALVIALVVFATMGQVALGGSLDTITGGLDRVVVLLFVGLMGVVIARELWTVVQTRR